MSQNAVRWIALSIVLGLLGTAVSAQTAQNPKSSTQAQTTKGAKSKSPTVRPWTEEPSSFMGIQLGKSLDEQKDNIIFCPTIKDRYGYTIFDPDYKGICYTGGKTTREVKNSPDLGFQYKMYMTVHGEVVDGFLIKVTDDARAKMLDLMTRRFGPALSRTTQTVQTIGGAQYEPATHAWIGKSVTIVFYEMLDRVDEGLLKVETIEAIERRTREKAENERAAESKI